MVEMNKSDTLSALRETVAQVRVHSVSSWMLLILKKKKKKKKLAQIWVKLWILLVEDITLIVFRKDN